MTNPAVSARPCAKPVVSASLIQLAELCAVALEQGRVTPGTVQESWACLRGLLAAVGPKEVTPAGNDAESLLRQWFYADADFDSEAWNREVRTLLEDMPAEAGFARAEAAEAESASGVRAPGIPCANQRVYLVATGLTNEGRELYERHDVPVPLADQEVLFSGQPVDSVPDCPLCEDNDKVNRRSTGLWACDRCHGAEPSGEVGPAPFEASGARVLPPVMNTAPAGESPAMHALRELVEVKELRDRHEIATRTDPWPEPRLTQEAADALWAEYRRREPAAWAAAAQTLAERWDFSGIVPTGYVWTESRDTPDSHQGPAEHDEEVCFDTQPPVEGTRYARLYSEDDIAEACRAHLLTTPAGARLAADLQAAEARADRLLAIIKDARRNSVLLDYQGQPMVAVPYAFMKEAL